MKLNPLNRKSLNKAALGLLAVVMVLTLVLVPLAPVFADDGNPPAQPTTTPGHPALEKAFQQEQSWLSTQADRLKRAADAAVKAQARIEQAKTAGLDVSALEEGLAVYQSQLATAQLSHDTAAKILAAHAGFDAQGLVTDPQAARTTVQTAGQSLKDARTVLDQAVKDARQLIKGWREKIRDAVQARLLEKAYQRQQEWLAKQASNLEKASTTGVQKAQAFIDQMKAQGQDTSALETALATYQRQLKTAQQAHDHAEKILSTHAGFDANGKVTEVAQARETVTSARQSLQDARTALSQAVKDLAKAIQDWRADHKLAPSPAPDTPT